MVAKTKIAKDSNISMRIILENIDVNRLICLHYAKRPRTLKIEEDNLQTMPQSIIPFDDEQLQTPTPIDELASKRIMYFLDVHKAQVKYWITMIDLSSNGALPTFTKKPCWWCRNSFNTRPLGCPLRYHPHKKVGIDKDRIEGKLKQANLPTDTNDFFETDGIFCSFPCCKAYILSNLRVSKYKNSSSLLTLMYAIFFGEIIRIPRAHPWKALKEWGGYMTIKEFRSSFGKLVLTETANMRRPLLYSSSCYIAEKKVIKNRTQ
jgi:hypothetical protein